MTCTNYANNPKADAAMLQNRKRPADEGFACAHTHTHTARHSHQHTRALKGMSGKSGKQMKRGWVPYFSNPRSRFTEEVKKLRGLEFFCKPNKSEVRAVNEPPATHTRTHTHTHTRTHIHTQTHYDLIAVNLLCRGWRCAKACAFAPCYTRTAEQNRWHDDNLPDYIIFSAWYEFILFFSWGFNRHILYAV